MRKVAGRMTMVSVKSSREIEKEFIFEYK